MTTPDPIPFLRRHGCKFHEGSGLIVVPHALVISAGVKAALEELCVRGNWCWEVAEEKRAVAAVLQEVGT
jgi:hypothetical protein